MQRYKNLVINPNFICFSIISILQIISFRSGSFVPSLIIRYAFVLPSLQVRSHRWSINGLITDLERTYNGTASEGVESSCRIPLKPVLSLEDGFENAFHVLHRFSSILSRVNLLGINAYCYAIETISCLYSALWFMHNSFIIFVLDSYKQDIGLAQQVVLY